ncbi:DUF5715 family protein [Roseisolibacter sp. H3M3-2]|uniref:DUF5715 family protein n=1 Tax=Roseisolibacter sp. H3M3-2 TaxID=3031323 RepID=UPI0023DAB7F0|nr:DUF5715 family protein [Roseisolibacter sp. H3M3-2]MDF1503012.1 DUF5715 family protein [Roseisolibacter sp. H3M3-2]
MPSPRLLAALLPAAALLLALPAAPAPAAAQTLRGSRGAVDRAFHTAKRRDLAFTRNRREIERGARKGAYVRLTASPSVRLKGVSAPFVRPTTRSFLATFAPRYRAACGEPLTVTSAMRPTSLHLRNASTRSVHPTGMALDFRAPGAACRSWMRRELLAYEKRGVVDATEERRPAHFHVVVYRAP